jgi:hypothetical protein
LPKRILGRTVNGFLIVKVVLSTVLLAYAATSSITTTNYRAIIGGQLNFVNVLSGADKGFSKASSSVAANGATCGGAIQFGPATGTATSGITSGHMIYDLQLNTTGTTPANTCWQVKLTYTTNGGALATVGPVWIGTGASIPPANQVIDCQFDIGSTLPSSPFSYAASATT